MCYILCLAVPKDPSDVRHYFDADLSIDVLNDEPIARATTGNQPEHAAYAVTLNGCSCDLLAGGHHMAGKPELMVDGLIKLLEDVAAVAVLNHWFTEPITEVDVKCNSEHPTTLSKFKKLFPKLEEDVRYIIRR